jgi:hypothetical protein
MNINYLKGPGTKPGTCLISCLPVSIRKAFIDLYPRVCEAWGRITQAHVSCWLPLLDKPAGTKAAGNGQALASCPGQLAARCLSLCMGPMWPAAWLQTSLTFDHKFSVSWKEIWASEAKEPGALVLLCYKCCVTLAGHRPPPSGLPGIFPKS